MCGIAGFVTTEQTTPLVEARALLQEMCDVIRHRGPDDEGLLVRDGAALGMRRLSIIDLATGHQPLANESGTVWTVFNGEIYNFRQLRQALQQRGHTFRTSSDTEVIVHGYEEWGEQVFRRLHGMFGLAIWDSRRRTLLLARDRMGIKPLYWTTVGDRLYFGSELKSLLLAPGLRRELDVDSLDHYLSFLYTPAATSIVAGCHKLPPGHLMHWRDGHMRITPYWQVPRGETFTGSEADAVVQLEHHLREAVASHLVSDVPLGAFLSGGLDSGLVVALMADTSPGAVKTFSIGFDEPAYDELDGARQVATHFGTEHHEFVVRPDAVAILDDLITHFDEPFADASAIPTYYVSRLAREHVTVVLSGDGGDELFGGYDRYLPHPRVTAFDRLTPAPLRGLAGIGGWLLPHGTRGRNFLRHVAHDARGRYVDAIRFFSGEDKRRLLTAGTRAQRQRPAPDVQARERFLRFEGLSWPAQMMRFDSETYLPEDILTKVDRMSMAHSIESRVPLLDHRLVEFAASLPAAFHLRNGERKRLLRQVAAHWLPEASLARPKRGFGVPLSLWFRGDWQVLCADTLLSRRTLERGYFEESFIRQLVSEHLSGQRDHTLRLWQLVVFERWHRLYLDGPTAQQPSSTNVTSRSAEPVTP